MIEQNTEFMKAILDTAISVVYGTVCALIGYMLGKLKK